MTARENCSTTQGLSTDPKQGFGGEIDEDAAPPAVRIMRRVEPPHSPVVNGELLAIREPAGEAGGKIIV